MKTNTNNTKTNIVFLLTLLLSTNLISTISISSNLKSKSESLLEEETISDDINNPKHLPKGEWFYIVVEFMDYCLMTSTTEGKKIIISNCTKSDAKLWKIVKKPNGYLLINKLGFGIDSSIQYASSAVYARPPNSKNTEYETYKTLNGRNGYFKLSSGSICLRQGKHFVEMIDCKSTKKTLLFKFKDI